MAESDVRFNIPAALLRYGIGKRDAERRINEWLVLSLFTEGRVSSGKAARLLGISRPAFLDLLRARGISYIDFSAEEIEEEIAAAEALGTTDSP